MSNITSRIRAAIGAAIIVVFASPAAAHAQAPGGVRAEAQWAGRQVAPWRMAHRRMLVAAWRHGHVRGYAMGRRPLPSAAWRRAYYGRGVMRERMYGRFWERQRLGRMGGRWAI